jgi:hypothetical protein
MDPTQPVDGKLGDELRDGVDFVVDSGGAIEWENPAGKSQAFMGVDWGIGPDRIVTSVVDRDGGVIACIDGGMASSEDIRSLIRKWSETPQDPARMVLLPDEPPVMFVPFTRRGIDEDFKLWIERADAEVRRAFQIPEKMLRGEELRKRMVEWKRLPKRGEHRRRKVQTRRGKKAWW